MKTIFIALLVLSAVFAQDEEIGLDLDNLDLGDAANQQRVPTPEELQRYNGMRRTACLVLSRHHSNARKDEVEGIIANMEPTQQQPFINKMYAVAIETCEKHISPDEVQKMYTENNNFDATEFFPIFAEVDYTALARESFKLTKNQEAIIQYVKQFDEEMAVKREEQQAEQEKDDTGDKYDIKIFGLSAKEIGTTSKVLYSLVFGGILAGLLYFGFKELNKAEQTKDKKKKSQKGKSASPQKNASPQKKTA